VLLMQVYENTEVKKRVANAKPYGKWLAEGSQKLEPVNSNDSTLYSPDSLLKHQQYASCHLPLPLEAQS
jgi:glutamate synthase (ferredoxin)